MKPWKLYYNGCCLKEYHSKRAAIKRGKVVKAHTPTDAKIYVSSAFECIDIN